MNFGEGKLFIGKDRKEIPICKCVITPNIYFHIKKFRLLIGEITDPLNYREYYVEIREDPEVPTEKELLSVLKKFSTNTKVSFDAIFNKEE